MSSDEKPDDTYVLGHVDTEIRRLLLQGRLHDDFTEHALRMAGLRPGMRVLDVGCGPGDVSFIAARLVGPTGQVIGVDSADNVIELARARAAEHGLYHVGFESAAIADVSLDEPVDAVIGRFILVHLPDPVATLRHLATMVRPGGLIAFGECDLSAAYTAPELPLWKSVLDGAVKAFEGVGLEPAFGAKLHALFRGAGLGMPRLTLGAPMGGADDSDILAYLVESCRSVFPVAESLGLIPDEVADLETLAQRLRDEATTAQAVAILPPMICGWATV